MKNFNNLGVLILFQNNNFNNKNFLNFKQDQQWQSFSNQDFFAKIANFASALENLGLKKGQSLVNYSYQNPIWLMVDLAAILAGAITVPIFNNISEDNLFYELSDCDAKFFFTDNEKICIKIKEKFPQIIIIGYGFKSELAIDFNDLISNKNTKIDNKIYIENLVSKIKNEDIATIVYTSGSTDRPKGVEISHQALISQINDSETFFHLDKSSIVLSYLPLAHIFERMVMLYYISKGLSIYFVDDIKNLGKFLQEIQPNLMTSVPRALEKVFAKINNGIEDANFCKKIIGKKALKRALEKDPLASKNFIDKIYDKIIYQKFRQALGGKMEMIICGGSALSQELERFYWNIGVKIYCGYGLTECSPVLATNAPNQHKFTSVGKAFPSVRLKISDDGELLACGINVMKNYHNNPQKTAETFDGEWLKTGDLAQIDDEGFVKIIGRKKEIFKTSNGKFVHPVLLEQKLVQELSFLAGAIVVAEGKNFVSALLFIDFDLLKNIKNKLKFEGENQQFLMSPILQNFVSQKIENINKKLDSWEQIKKFKIIAEPISVETGEITPSMKLKRNILEKKFALEIADLYQISED
jgi:long-chain acyl-CoA synthetase